MVSAKDMANAVKACYKEQDIIIKAAAVADYRPVEVSDEKMKKGCGAVDCLGADGGYPAVSG